MWLHLDVEAAIRRAMDLERARLAEQYIIDEAVQFVRRQTEEAPSSSSDMQIVLVDPTPEDEAAFSRSRSSSMPPEFESINEYLAHLRAKYKMKKKTFMARPRVVPPISISLPSDTPSSASTPSSNPTPGSAAIRGRFKKTARKRVPRTPLPPRAPVQSVSEDEPVPPQKEVEAGSSSNTQSVFEQAQETADAIPAEVEVKVEVDEMSQEEFEYFGTTNLTFSQAQMLDAMRSAARVKKGKKGDLSQDPEYPAWAFKVKKVHLPSGTVPIDFSPPSQQQQVVGMDEDADLRRAIEDSLETERQEKERAEREHLEDLARIREAEEAELKELWDRCEEGSEQMRRERERQHRS